MFKMILSQARGRSVIDVDFPDERDPNRLLLSSLLLDMWGQEDVYLSYIAKAEVGETILNLYNHDVDMQLYPDGRVVIEELRFDDEDRAERGEPAKMEMTLAEAKRLILDWLDAKAKWQAAHGALHEETVPESR